MPKTPRKTAVPFPQSTGKDDPSTPSARSGARSRKVEEIDVGFAGQRKLIRPVLPENAAAHHDARRRSIRSMLGRRNVPPSNLNSQDASHAESFYFQKQIQTQTPMVFVLESGEQIEGVIEWYDRNCIKVRNSGRVLIYKSSIKYLYKASERQSNGPMTLV